LAYQVIQVFFYGLKWGDIHRKYQNLKVQGKKSSRLLNSLDQLFYDINKN